ncbi:type VI secretion system lipoprotein TssJ [Roseomonas sp. AR75]|jgi:type VI secretion system protein VasD|uniref:type VI secretion system lipoprotein TssJ n=1 Tax=Roseomonas sp. AR75 TaxID=2562311 RepID=UPI0010C083EA|nr:type VI secretion system lipoprotein TssJ [Roseomonas sp. AR75]
MTITRRLALASLLLLGACGATPPPPAVVTLKVQGSADQNPDPSGRPSPVALHVFLLNATAKFERGDVFALTEREQATLGADSAGSEQFVIAPGESREITRELRPGVQAIGLVALFRDVDSGARWRAVVPIATSGPSTIRVRLERNAVIATREG